MRILRTPEERFLDLPDYPFPPSYVEVASGDGDERLRVHHVDEGEGTTGETVLVLHGEPSWSFLYRHMIPVFAGAGHRCIAPDLVGFGRSDKPAERSDYTYQRHVDWMREALFDRLDLRGVTLVCQDWGGLIGLRLVAEHPERFARVVVANTFLPTGEGEPSKAFLRWREFSQSTPELRVGDIVRSGCHGDLTPEVVAAYDAPFPDDAHKAGARRFPTLVPVSPDDPAAGPNRAAWESLRRFDKPFLCAFGDEDPITGGLDRVFREQVPGARGLEHPTIAGAGHFLQEDRGTLLAETVNRFIADTPVSA
ncbi:MULTISPECIES: haloalkane dehalogenase [unclassified Streptomyces]|uniref:haloalkane dehalogenase n=1 Tax=unclassified Streptomyces TaxID=2593676 RepID=UPI0019032BEE|nr:haloalkane dehalogenase [Streptomyces sp. HSG2]